MLQKSVSLDPNERKALSVRRYLLLLLGLQLITVSLILIVTQVSINRDIDRQADTFLQHAVAQTAEYTRGFLEPASRSVNLTEQLLANNALGLEYRENLEQFLLGLLQNNEEVEGAFVVNNAGDFFYVAHNNSKQQDSAYVTKYMAGDIPGKANFIYRDENLSILSQENGRDDSYDVLQRPWHQKIMEQKKLVWTEPYIFFTSQEPGVTVAIPVLGEAGEILGAVGFDITLIKLSQFFSGLKIFDIASAFIISGNGTLVAAHHLQEQGVELQSLDIVSESAGNLSLDRAAISHFAAVKDNDTSADKDNRFVFEGQEYSMRYEVLSIANGPEWIVAAYAPKNAFLAMVEAGGRRNIWVGLAILLVSIIFGWFLVRKTWQPVSYFVQHVVSDQLTGLYNRRFMETVGSRMYLHMLRDSDSVLSIAAIGVDSFKKVNAEFGSSVGNRVLINFANFLRNTLGDDEVICRYSGDVFIVVLPGLSESEAVQKMDGLRLRLDAWPLIVDDFLVKITFSAGVVAVDGSNRVGDAAFSDYLRMAKVALGNAKHAGRDCVLSIESSSAAA